MLYKCAFCRGTGKDPFHLLSELSTCQVCNGRKTVEIKGNVVKCAYCNGNGKQRGDGRVPCIACGGRGLGRVENPKTCPNCRGSGRVKETTLTCLKCHGYGSVEEVKNEGRKK